MTIEIPLNSNRIFKGNQNYLDFYNREVKRFFSRDINENSKLSTSKINASGKVIYKADENYEENYGTIWSGVEKEIFFQCLTRNSINRIDLIKDRLPDKSEVEILNYYNILKKELKRQKLREGKRKKFKLRYGEKDVIQSYVKHSKKLVSYSKLPIAFEISPYFIQFEEVQSSLISKFERSKSNDENQRFKKIFEHYTNDTFNEGLTTQETQHDNSNESLIKFETTLQLTNNLYKHNLITPLSNLKLVPKLHYKSIVLLEELAVLKLKSVLYDIIESKINKNWLNKRHKSEEMKISLKDVNNSLQNIRKRDNSPTSLAGYFLEIITSLNVNVVNDLNGESNNMTTDEYKAVALNKNKPKKNDEPRKSKYLSTIIMNPNENTYQKDPFYFQDDELFNKTALHNGNIPHISSIVSSKVKISNSYPIEVEEKLINLESALLDSKDELDSRVYEHALLTYLSTNKLDDGTVSSTMFDESEAAELLSEWREDNTGLEGDLFEEELNMDHSEQRSDMDKNSEKDREGQTDPQFVKETEANIETVEVDELLLKNFDYEYSYYTDDDSIEVEI